MTTLGRSYSRSLRIEDDQAVVTDGPYRLIRHPGYAGSLLLWGGFALTSSSPLVVALVAALLGPAYLRRMRGEEALLERDLPGYAEYRRRTARLVPRLW
jgi:protein-S-isoprenylcysteine O-methyltransferase Ste14